MLQCERDNLINLFKIDNCVRDYYIKLNIPFNESDINSEKFVIKYMGLENSEHDQITKEYADFVSRILIYRINVLNDFLGVENVNEIINNFRIKDYKILTWINLLQSYMRLIGICHKEIESCEASHRNSIYYVKFEVTEQFAKTLMDLIFGINNILGKKIEDHNNHNIELLKKVSINKLLDSFDVGNFIESFRSEALCEKSPNSNPDDFIRNYILMDGIDRMISYRYTYFLNRSISSKRDDVYRFLGEDVYKFISEAFKSDNYYGSVKSWDDLIDKYRNIIHKCDKEIKLNCCKRLLYSGDPSSLIENLQYRISIKLACSLIDFVNSIKREESKRCKSEISPKRVISKLELFFKIENCIKYYMLNLPLPYNYKTKSQFIDDYIFSGIGHDYDNFTANYVAFINYCIDNFKRRDSLKSIVQPIDNSLSMLADAIIEKLKIFYIYYDDEKKTWDDLLDYYVPIYIGRDVYEVDEVINDVYLFCEMVSKMFAKHLINFVNDIKDVAEKKKANKFSSLFGNNLDFTHGTFADVEVGYPRSVKTEEGGYCTIAGVPELLGIDYSEKPALAMRAMGIVKGKGITPEEFKNLIEKIGSSPLTDNVNKLIEQEKERRNKIIDRLEYDMLHVYKDIHDEFYSKLLKHDANIGIHYFLNNINGGNNNMNQKAFTIKDIIFSGDRTIALWENGDKTIVRMQDDETVYDPEKAIMALFMKRVYEMYNLPARQKSMNKDLDKYLAKYNEHKDEIANYLINKKYKKTADDTNKAE